MLYSLITKVLLKKKQRDFDSVVESLDGTRVSYAPLTVLIYVQLHFQWLYMGMDCQILLLYSSLGDQSWCTGTQYFQFSYKQSQKF